MYCINSGLQKSQDELFYIPNTCKLISERIQTAKYENLNIVNMFTPKHQG